MKVDVKIDYIRATARHIRQEQFEKTGSIERPMYGYSECTEIAYGGSVVGQFMSGTQGELIQISGRGMETLRKSGMTDDNTLRVLSGTNKTRIDVAIDVRAKPEPVLRDMYEQLKLGKVKTQTKKFGQYQTYNEDMGFGTTVSVGSRNSERYLRAYNKTVESGLVEWVLRLELETKGTAAKRLPGDIEKQGLERTAGALFADFAMFKGFYSRVIEKVGKGEITKVRPEKRDDETFFEKVIRPYLLARIDTMPQTNIEWMQLYVNEWRMKNGGNSTA